MRSGNVTVSVSTYVKSKRRSFLWNLMMIVVAAGFWLIWMLIRRRKEKVVTQKTAVCGNCAYSWKPKRGTPEQRRKRLIIAGAVVAGLFVLGSVMGLLNRDKPGGETPTRAAAATADTEEAQAGQDANNSEYVTDMRYTISILGENFSGKYTGNTVDGKPEDSNGRFEHDTGTVYIRQVEKRQERRPGHADVDHRRQICRRF